jgi:cell division protein FtsW
MSGQTKHGADLLLLFMVVGLILFGLVMVATASSIIGERHHGDQFFFVKHQALYGGISGIALFIVGFFVPYRYLKVLALPAMVVCLCLLVLVFVPGIHRTYQGASRWLDVGPITIQPTEITKLAFIIYLAALLDKKGEDVKDFKKSVVPFLVIMTAISVLIVLQPDIGTLFSIAVIACTMVYVAGFRLRHLMMIGLTSLAAFTVLLNTARYRLERIMVYLHPELDPQGIGYQINQALLAASTGGLWGLGLGRSRQKYYYLPEPAGDSIFAIIAEELGLVRSMTVLAVFVLIGLRGYSIAKKAPDIFGRLLATGITTWIMVQAFLNIGSIIGITPMTGIPLPYISYGGSALGMIMLATGILLNVSKYTNQ